MAWSPPIKEKGLKKARSVRVIDLTRLEQRLLNAMSRESYRLLDASYERMLEKNESEALARYVKLTRDLKANQEKLTEYLPEEELKKKLQD
jgi:uncharacterized protein YbjQ (UPF0145 family)